MEIISKNKKGRPKKIDYTMIKSLWNDKGKRHHNNIEYYNNAIALLIDKDEYIYLVDRKKQRARTTILTEIGRIADIYGNDTALNIAKYVCDNKLNTMTAINYIKAERGLLKNKVMTVLKKITNIINNSYLTETEMQDLLIYLQCLETQNTKNKT